MVITGCFNTRHTCWSDLVVGSPRSVCFTGETNCRPEELKSIFQLRYIKYVYCSKCNYWDIIGKYLTICAPRERVKWFITVILNNRTILILSSRQEDHPSIQ